MAYNKLNLDDEIKPSTLESAKHFNEGIYKNQNIELIAISEEAPTEYSVGDKYYNKTDKLIHAATENGFGNGEAPIRGAFYIVIEQQGVFYFDGNDLISVGGGASGGDGLPVGSGTVWFSNIAPKNYLICNGSAISRTNYKKLFETIGTTYGQGDGSTTFNLPKVDGKTLVGLDSTDEDFDTLGKIVGEKKHKLTISEMPSHAHSILGDANSGSFPGTSFNVPVVGNQNFGSKGMTEIEGQSKEHNIVQPSLVINYIIKALDDTTLDKNGKILNEHSDSEKDTYSCDYINQLNKYSTEEVFTGKYWIDEKKIYRRIFVGTTDALTEGTIAIINNIDTLVKFDGTHNDGNYYGGLYWINSNLNQFRQFYYMSSNGQINFLQTIKATLNYRIIVEYTKTNE